MNRIIKNFLIPILFIFTVFLYGQDDCPDDLTMFQAPGEGEPGCMDYNDCNDNGAFDLGEPCYDAPPPEGDYGDTGDFGDMGDNVGGEMDPVSDAYFSAIDDGADPSEAFEAASNVVYELEVINGDMSEEEFQQGNAMASDAFNNAIDDGADPGEAWDATMEAVDQMDEMGEGDDYMDEDQMDPIDEVAVAFGDHTWLNCEALSMGAPSYWIEDDEFATYDDPLCEEVFLDFFDAIDGDDDGNISMEEASAVWGQDPNFEAVFNENDMNGDGFVDEGEFMAGSEPPEDMMDDDGGEEEMDEEQEGDGFYCAICDLHFATEEEMDQHVADEGHIDTDHDNDEDDYYDDNENNEDSDEDDD